MTRDGSDSLELVGPRRVIRDSHVPSFESLERMIAAARARHRELADRYDEMKNCTWFADELSSLKKRKLLEKDRVTALVALARRDRRNADMYEIGSGHYGKVLLGRSERYGRVAIKVMPANLPDEDRLAGGLERESSVLSAMSGQAGFPTLYHAGRQTLLGRPSEVFGWDTSIKIN